MSSVQYRNCIAERYRGTECYMRYLRTGVPLQLGWVFYNQIWLSPLCRESTGWYRHDWNTPE